MEAEKSELNKQNEKGKDEKPCSRLSKLSNLGENFVYNSGIYVLKAKLTQFYKKKNHINA